MMLNYAKLNWKIRDVCGSQGKLAKEIGMSQHSLSMKLNQKTEFKVSEIMEISKVLGLTSGDIADYFFAVNAQNVEDSAERESVQAGLA